LLAHGCPAPCTLNNGTALTGEYERWEIEDAVKSFELAAQSDPANPDHYLNLAWSTGSP